MRSQKEENATIVIHKDWRSFTLLNLLVARAFEHFHYHWISSNETNDKRARKGSIVFIVGGKT